MKTFLTQFVWFLTMYCNPTHSLNLQQITSASFNQGTVHTLKWVTVGNRSYLAVAGAEDTQGQEIRLYKFDIRTGHLILIDTISFCNGSVQSLDWIKASGKYYLALGGNEVNSIVQNIRIYKFDHTGSENLELAASASFNPLSSVNTVKWLPAHTPGTSNHLLYLSVTGDDPVSGQEVRVYSFNTLNNQLEVTLATASFYNGSVQSSDWLTIKNDSYLAVGGFEHNSIVQNIRIYKFNPQNSSDLEFVASAPFNNSSVVNAVSWLSYKNKTYLAVAGEDPVANKEIRIYQFNPTNFSLRATDATASFAQGTVLALEWVKVKGNFYLTAGGLSVHPQQPQIEMFLFNSTTEQLTSQVKTLQAPNPVNAIDWNTIRAKKYLAVGGQDDNGSEIRIYQLTQDLPPGCILP